MILFKHGGYLMGTETVIKLWLPRSEKTSEKTSIDGWDTVLRWPGDGI